MNSKEILYAKAKDPGSRALAQSDWLCEIAQLGLSHQSEAVIPPST